MIVALDVGASKVRAGVFEYHPQSEAVFYGRYLTSDWKGLIPLLRALMAEAGRPKIERIVVGLAGPVVGRRAQMTNLSWAFDCDEIEAAFPGTSVRLVNDLVAHGYGTLEVSEQGVVCLKPGADRPGNRALIAAGSGLGECILFWDGDRYVPTPSEGGHADFAPATEVHIDLLRYIKHKHPSHVSWERVISGNYGFENLYGFLVSRGHESVPEIDEAIATRRPLGPLIQSYAEKSEPTVLETIGLFYELYAAEAGNLALKAFATGGLFVSGGIARKLEAWLDAKRFADAFVAKGRMQPLLEDIPVYLVTDPNAAVHGLAAFARQAMN